LIIAHIERSKDLARVPPRASLEQPRLPHRCRTHDDSVRTQAEQLVDLLLGSHSARHLHLHVSPPDDGLDRCVVVAEASRAVEVDNMYAFRSGLGKACRYVCGIIRVDGRIRVITADEADTATAQDVDGRDDEH
jgi:hypothetical protein